MQFHNKFIFLVPYGAILFLVCLYYGSVQLSASSTLAAAEQDSSIGLDIRINEFVAHNRNGIADEDGDLSDWIELYNSGSHTMDLIGWYLTDDEDNLTKWQFPQRKIASDDYLLIFASDKDRALAVGPLHTNFKLSRSGEYLALVKPDGQTIAWSYVYPPQETDMAYGLDRDGNEHFLDEPTPGQANQWDVDKGQFVLRNLQHHPAQPLNTQDLWVQVAVDGESHLQVELHYRIMFNEIETAPMYDDGTHRDGAAQDGIYGTRIKATNFQPNQLVRYAVVAIDDEGAQTSIPFNNTQLENYQGTVVLDPTRTSALPVLYWYTEEPNWYKTANDVDKTCQWLDCYCEPHCENPYLKTYTTANIFYAGEFYNNVAVRIRGASSVWTKTDKQSLKFEFRPDQLFQYHPTRPRVDEINVNALWLDKSYIRNALSMELYQSVGVPASDVGHIVLYRNGSFHSLASLVEQVDSRFLARHGLDPQGALYKIYNRLDNTLPRRDVLPGEDPDTVEGVEKKSRRKEDYSDLQGLIDGLQIPDEPERTAFIFDHVDVPAALNYLAISTLIGDWDMFRKNFYVYRNNEHSAEWQLLPWDRDQGWGSNWKSDYVEPQTNLFHSKRKFYFNKAFFESPQLSAMYLRRLRTVLDMWLQPPTAPRETFRLERQLDEYSRQLIVYAAFDRDKWGIPYGYLTDFREAIDRIKFDYIQPVRVQFYADKRLPPSQSQLLQQWTGEPPIQFGTIEARPKSNHLDEAYIELQNQANFALDLSGWQISGDITYTLRSGVVLAPEQSLYISPNVMAFRKRTISPVANERHFVQGNYEGVLPAAEIQLAIYDEAGNLIDKIVEKELE